MLSPEAIFGIYSPAKPPTVSCTVLPMHFFIPFHLSHPTSHIPPPTAHHKLNLSKLNRSPLLTRLTTPNLKNFSSPVAVRPPIYNFSVPSVSLNPSVELLLPLRLAALRPWGMGIAWCARGERGRELMTPFVREEEGVGCGWEVEDEAGLVVVIVREVVVVVLWVCEEG